MQMTDLAEKVNGMVADQPVAPPVGTAPQGTKWIVLESRLLDGEHVVIVCEKRWYKAARQEHPDKVLYFPPEIDELARHKDDPETIKAMHRIKKEFRGWLLPSQKGDDCHEHR